MTDVVLRIVQLNAGKISPTFTVAQEPVFGSAILSRWPIDHHRHWELPLAPTRGPGDTGAVGAPPRRDRRSRHLLDPPLPAPHHGDHRRAQVLAIDASIREIRGDEIRFLASLTMLDGRSTFYQDAWRVAGEGPGHTQDWRTNRIAASLNVHRKRIDYVFVGDPFLRKGGAGRILNAALAFDTALTGVLASDHIGLVVDIVWPSKPAVV